ncbi:MAG: hypothetical protein K2F82_03900, partial [Muribaculaceae bacterium]|nr:hypothetical protein [Muribaculaceae bacterium]
MSDPILTMFDPHSTAICQSPLIPIERTVADVTISRNRCPVLAGLKIGSDTVGVDGVGGHSHHTLDCG